MKYFFAIVFSMFLAMSASAERPVNVELPSFVKEQTGLYQVANGSTTTTLSGTGMTIEVFKAGERVLLNGTTLSTDFVFATVYNSRGEYYVMNGPVVGKTASVDVFRLASRDDDGTVNYALVGLGTLTVDPSNEGIADAIHYNLFVNTDILGFNSRLNTLLTGRFLRISDADIVRCVQVTPEDGEGVIDPVLLPCRKTLY